MKSNKSWIYIIVFVLIQTSAAQNRHPHLDSRVAFGIQTYDSLKRTQIKATHVRRSTLMGYEKNMSDSLILKYVLNISFDENGYLINGSKHEYPDDKYDSTTMQYDPYGFASVVSYDVKGSIVGTDSSIYDSSSRRLMRKIWRRGPPEERSISCVDYDSLGNCIRYSADGYLLEIIYDGSMRKSVERTIIKNDTSYTVYRYSNDSRVDTATSVEHQEPQSRTININDSTGRLIKNIYEGIAYHRIAITEMTYDDSGMTSIYKNGVTSPKDPSCYITRTNKKGYWVEQITRDKENHVTDKGTNFFDKDGNVVLTVQVWNIGKKNESQNITKWFYQYFQ
jgi:hypothetical protein